MKTKLLITGATGFIGSHLIEGVLKNTDWDIIIVDRLDISGDPNRLTDIDIWPQEGHRVKFVWWDLKAALNDSVKKKIGHVDYIWHLAAASHVDRSIEDPMSFIMDNVVGATNILLYAKEVKPELFINFSTDEVFGSVKTGFSKEFDHHHPKNPYSASKSGQEAIGEAFENCYGLKVITTHTMNVMGERQHPEKFIPTVIRKVRDGETVTIHANKEKTQAGIRSYIHARNVCDALLFLTQRGFQGYDEWNIVGEQEIDNLALAKAIAEIVGKPLKYEMVDFHSSRPGHDLRYALDGSKLAGAGWTPPKTFMESLEKTVKWYLERPEWLEK